MVDSPEEISLDALRVNNKISIELKGKTTVFLDIDEMEKNGCEIDIPPDVKAIFLKFHESVAKGLNGLKGKFPEHLETIELFLGIPSSNISVTHLAQT